MQNIELKYTPLTSKGSVLSRRDFVRYCNQQGLGKIVDKVLVDPVTEILKEKKGETIVLGSLELSRTESQSNSTEWKSIVTGLEAFLEIRADDARAGTTEGVTYIQGIGYCIDSQAWQSQIEKEKEANTTRSTKIILGWPAFTKEDKPVRRIEFPLRDYRNVDEEVARLAIEGRRFTASHKREVLEPFKETVKAWHQAQTGYSKSNIPPVEESPSQRSLKVGEGMYALVQLVRVEDIAYEKIVTSLKEEIRLVAQRQPVEGYRATVQGDQVFVNIKSLKEREEALRKRATSVTSRYEIVP